MKKHQLLFSTLTAALITLSSVSFATIDKCPSEKAIASLGLNHAEFVFDSTWVATSTSKFDTQNEWTFVIGFFDAENMNGVLDQANTSLSGLHLEKGPIVQEKTTACVYKNDLQHVWGVAFTPPMSEDFKSMLYRFK